MTFEEFMLQRLADLEDEVEGLREAMRDGFRIRVAHIENLLREKELWTPPGPDTLSHAYASW